jgi:hypothetical protein
VNIFHTLQQITQLVARELLVVNDDGRDRHREL